MENSQKLRMDMGRVAATILLLVLLIMRPNVLGEGLSFDFYDQSCPKLEHIVKASVLSASILDPTTPAALLRLMFHDCQVQGCDASILLDPAGNEQSEMGSSKNLAIRKRETISLIKSLVESACPRLVSCADILILAAREAVAISGGPRIKVPLGRRDSSNPPSPIAADDSLPPADIGVDGMLRMFLGKGMTIEESVAILGAHTLGVTHCLNLRNITSNRWESNLMETKCPLPLGSPAIDRIPFVQNDPTALLFDNTYYVNAMIGRGILAIDAEMPLDPRTAPYVLRFAEDQDQFFQAFSSAFVKLSSSGVLSGGQGVVRQACNTLN